MNISAKTDYTLRAVFELAQNRIEGTSSISEIAKRQSIPKRYLEHLLLMLKKAKLVDSIRGKKGGYVLKRNPESITVGEVIRSVEGPVNIAPKTRVPRKFDPVSETWESIQDAIEKLLDSITVADLLEKKLAAEKTLTYYI